MADIDDEQGSQVDQQEEEELVWEDPVEDIESMEDGPRTIIVGGSSRIDTVDDALERYRGPGDRIIIMPGIYETGMILDSAQYPRLQIYGAFPAPTVEEEKAARLKAKDLEERAEEIAEQEAMNRWLPPPTYGPDRAPVVVFKGKLSVQYNEANTPNYDEEEGAPLAEGATSRLTVSNIHFQGGASVAEESNIALEKCAFGIPHLPSDPRSGTPSDDAVREPRTVRVHALATPLFDRCKIYGSDKSALYCYPYARAQFTNCDVVGMVTPPPPTATPSGGGSSSARRMKAAAPTPTLPPTKAPHQCLSDAGIHLDDAQCTFHQCSVSNFNLGVVTNDPCTGSKFTECSVSEISAVGYLLGASSNVNMRECKARLCGREAVVVGARSHVSMRDCCYAGDVRLKDEAILTALVDNCVGPESANFKVISEAKAFSDRGFTVSEDDPSARKKRKPQLEEE